MGEKRDILSMSLPELQEVLTAMGEPRFRAGQVYRWLHLKKVTTFVEMLDIPAKLRDKLDAEFCIKSLFIAKGLHHHWMIR